MVHQPAFDLVVRNGTLFDGSGSEGVRADIGVRAGRIVTVGEVAGRGAVDVDAAGLAVIPGFIDVHTHDDLAVLLEPGMPFKVMQGVTTDIVGNCGFGPAPFEAGVRMLSAISQSGELSPWQGHAGYFRRLDETPRSLNVGVLMGHGTIRLATMGMERRQATPAEQAEMESLVREGTEAGALGLSTGLVYEPGRYAATDEVVGLARAMAASGGGLYATHMRNEGHALLDSIRETLHIGREAGVPVQISHHKAVERTNYGRVKDSLALIDEARAEGMDVSADQYPYTASSTSLAALLLNGAFAEVDGKPITLPDEVMVASAPRHPEWDGKALSVLMQPGETLAGAVQRIVDAEGPGCTAVIFRIDEQDVRTVLAHPTTMIGSDGLPSGGNPHPRLYGTFPRVLGHYARDLGVIDFATAVHKMTGMAAVKFGLGDRGFLRPGYAADIVILDAATVADTATYEDPRRYPTGIRDVFVNGIAVVRNAVQTSAMPGRALRRGA